MVRKSDTGSQFSNAHQASRKDVAVSMANQKYFSPPNLRAHLALRLFGLCYRVDVVRDFVHLRGQEMSFVYALRYFNVILR